MKHRKKIHYVRSGTHRALRPRALCGAHVPPARLTTKNGATCCDCTLADRKHLWR
jgi:hypothetical protein